MRPGLREASRAPLLRHGSASIRPEQKASVFAAARGGDEPLVAPSRSRAQPASRTDLVGSSGAVEAELGIRVDAPQLHHVRELASPASLNPTAPARHRRISFAAA